MHRENQYKVVFVDALRGVHNLSAEESGTPHQVYRALALLFPGATLVLIHHDRKTKYEKGIGDKEKAEMADESFSGSQAWINHATVAIKIEHYNKKKHEIKLVHTKSQASEQQPPLILKVRDGINFQTPSVANQEVIGTILADTGEETTAKEKDQLIAEFLGVSMRTAQRKRLEYEGSSLRG